jgi:hypothetical protein
MRPLVYRCGQRIPASGVYCVAHTEHRLVPEVHSLEGESSPRFLECDKVVHFSLVREVPKVNGLREKIVLNAIPQIIKDVA